MMIEPSHAITILLMASVTYMTRIGGYIFLRNRTLSPRAQLLLESAPGCVLISVIAPDFVTGNPADIIALLLTIAAATRFPMLVTVIVAITSAGLLRHMLG
ncbi:branched-chain amino acid transport family protein [Brucella rhizosphaerae]|uniref:Branched-chain amino acid transport family protein n=2 Tax=Brucella rhizosphaerae TaxID=571254 RepID=A0A256FDX0_9HYPH|nr:branched-chain amino acid transport family protein [Brucella rhizosphaerae]